MEAAADLRDKFGRIHDYLRISLTDACNLRCRYCMPDGDYRNSPGERFMKPDEIFGIAEVFCRLGIRKIRLTGGEPLMRKDFDTILSLLSKLPLELALTTNGLLLERHTSQLAQSGLRHINISLDALEPEAFREITRNGDLEKVMAQIRTLSQRDFVIKVNVVVMKGVNEQYLSDFSGLTKELPIEVRFIEFMPFDRNRWTPEYVTGYKDMLSIIRKDYDLEKEADGRHDTTKKYRIKNSIGKIGFISTVTDPFCEGCNRLRITADGKIKNCLFSRGEADLLGPYRKGEDITGIIHRNVSEKEERLGGRQRPDSSGNRSMIRIGG
jgi:cyclic pyranopterin phosphate synthase